LGAELSGPKRLAGAGANAERRKGSVVALNNLCVDIMVEMDELPGAGAAAKRATLLQLQGSPPPDTSAWEVGGASNFAIAAARLGVDCTCLGHLGRDSYGTCASSPAAHFSRQRSVQAPQTLALREAPGVL
jgi:hypothetical protein